MASVGTISIVVPNLPVQRTPGVFFGVDNSGANTATPLQQTLIIGQMLPSGTAVANQAVAAQSLTQVQTLCGVGSMLANMYATYVGDDGFGSITLLPVADASGSVATVATATVTGPATATGVLPLYVCGQFVPVAVAAGDSANVIAANIVAALAPSEMPNLPCTASNTNAVVTLTAKNKGAAAGDLDLRLAYAGPLAGETVPAGVAVAFAVTTSGATDPVLTTALATLGDATSFAFIVSPYSGPAQLASIQALLSDVTGTWSPLTNTSGGAFSAVKGTFGGLSTYGISNNYQHISVLGMADTPTPVYQIAASYGAACANSLRVDASLPLTAIVLNGIKAPPVASRLSRANRNTLLYDGIATTRYNRANQTILERAVTTYQQNLLGAPDNSYLDVNILYQLAAIIAMWKSALSSKYARMKLVDNNTTIVPGTYTTNPNAIRGEIIAQYQIACNAGLCQNPTQFITGVNVQKVSANQVNVYAPIILSDGLYVLGIDLAFSQ